MTTQYLFNRTRVQSANGCSAFEEIERCNRDSHGWTVVAINRFYVRYRYQVLRLAQRGVALITDGGSLCGGSAGVRQVALKSSRMR